MKKLTKATLFVFSLALACTKEGPSSGGGEQVSAPEPEAKTEAAAETLPEGEELLAAHVAAAGGAKLIPSFDSIHAVGTISVPGQQLTGTSEVWWQKGGKFYLEQDVEGIGKSRAGYDGETIWLDDPISGLRVLEGQEAASYLQSSLMFPGHDWKQHFASAKTIGKVETDAGAVWEVELSSKKGVNTTVGLDADTKLIRYMKTTQVTPMGAMPIESHSEGYETVEGYLFAMKKRSSIQALLELREEITTFEVNVELDESKFAFPTTREQIPADPSQQPPLEAPTPEPEAPAAEAPEPAKPAAP